MRVKRSDLNGSDKLRERGRETKREKEWKITQRDAALKDLVLGWSFMSLQWRPNPLT